MKATRLVGLALLGLLVSCSDAGLGGRTQVLLTDGPFPYDRIARVDIHIVRVEVASTPDTTVPQTWITLVEPNRTINLLELQAGQTTLLGETDVDAGTVGMVRVTINTALSSLTGIDGQPIMVRWGVNGQMSIHANVQSSLALFADGTPHNLIIDFDVGRSFDYYGDGSLVFIPWIRVLDGAGAGAVAGVVRGAQEAGRAPLANVAVTVLQGDPGADPTTWWKVATGKTDAQGQYRVAVLLQGKYIVRAEPVASPNMNGCIDVTEVLVSNGTTTTLDVDLPEPPGTCARHTGHGGGPDTTGTGGTDTTGTGGVGPVATVTVTVWPQTLTVGDSAGAFANLANAQGASLYGRAVTWSVSDTTVLRVGGVYGQSLLLWPRSVGTATITATSEGVTGSRVVTVQ